MPIHAPFPTSALATALGAALLAAFAPLSPAQTPVGSPPIDRLINDSASGLICIYLGATQPVSGPGTLGDWTFFDNEAVTNGQPVTPLLFQRVGADRWRIVGIGTTRFSSASGAQTFPFAPIAGPSVLSAGVDYTFGFTHRSYTAGPSGPVPGIAGAGTVDFDGYGLTADRWAYVFGIAALGLEVTGATPPPPGVLSFDPAGAGGRIYSARVLVDRLATVPGCLPNGASLASTAKNIALGASLPLNLTAPGFQAGIWQVYVGALGVNPSGCGLLLPGLGELLLSPSPLVPLLGGALAGGSATGHLTVPQNPALAGQQVALQGFAVALDQPGFPIQLTNALAALIQP